MRESRWDVRLPETSGLGQDEEYCLVVEDGRERRVRFHDYHEIFARPGLYEQLFDETLKCVSPRVVSSLLGEEVERAGGDPGDLRVLDLGAGNGMVGEALVDRGVGAVVGADIIPEAAEAALRERPGVYADYVIADFTDLPADAREALAARRLNALTCVAALGFGDIPPAAFGTACNLIADGGWLAFNIKETFVDGEDSSGFSRLIEAATGRELIDVQVSHRYRHRVAIDGTPLHYVAMVARKRADIPAELFAA